MDYLRVIGTSAFSVVALFFLTRLMGKKQISQLNLFDYINGITIGSIAAEMASGLEGNILLPLIAMVVYTCFSVLFSFFEHKSLRFNKFTIGTATILFDKGVLYEQNLIKSKINIPEFLSICRCNGYFNLSDIQTALLEPNGKISFLPKSEAAPLVPRDMNIQTPQAFLSPNVILDGKIMYANLKLLKLDETWLLTELQNQGINSPTKVFLATCDDNKNLSVYIKVSKKNNMEPFV